MAGLGLPALSVKFQISPLKVTGMAFSSFSFHGMSVGPQQGSMSALWRHCPHKGTVTPRWFEFFVVVDVCLFDFGFDFVVVVVFSSLVIF